jgi:hypothetical protein
MIKTIEIVISLIIGIVIGYFADSFLQEDTSKFEAENRMLKKHVDALMAENSKLESINEQHEEKIIILTAERELITGQIKYVYYTSHELLTAPNEVITAKMDTAFSNSPFYDKDSSYFKTTSKVASGIKEYPIFLIDRKMGIDYLYKDGMFKTLTDLTGNLYSSNELLTQQKNNYIKEIDNYKLAMTDQNKIVSNTTLLFKEEKKKRKFFESFAYGATASTVLLCVNQKPTIALPIGLVVTAGKFFLFN